MHIKMLDNGIDDISISPNELWTTERIIKLIEE